MDTSIIIILFSYLLGSIPSAIIICRLLKLSDPRESGSGNPGTTNVMRLHGKKIAAMTLASDVLKGVLPVLIARHMELSEITIASCGLAAFLGHLFPFFFTIKGGKGVATLIGVLFASNIFLGFSFIITWLFIAFIFKYSSLAAITSALLMPVYSWFILHGEYYLGAHLIMMMIIILRHQANIKRLIAKKENKMGKN